jgi:ornithine cyclodeaminase/alanine dehydrogenase-like protein (mu-crystallin family)
LAIHLTEQEVEALFIVSDAMDSARRAFAALGSGQVTQPPRITTPIPAHDAAHLSMPCYLRDAEGEVLAMKAVTIFPHNRETRDLPTTLGFVVLYDPATGQPLAFIEAELLTARRTAAGCALASTYLARPDSSVLGVLGVGMQATAHVEALAPLFNLEAVKVFSPGFASTEAFCVRMSDQLGIPFVACQTPRECVSNADIVCAATSSSVPVFAGIDLEPGTHVNAIGSYRPDMSELDQDTVSMSRVFVDSRDAAERGAGELIQAHGSGAWNWTDLGGELSDLVLGRVTGRQSEDEITLFKSVGLAVQDATAAHSVYQQATR